MCNHREVWLRGSNRRRPQGTQEHHQCQKQQRRASNRIQGFPRWARDRRNTPDGHAARGCHFTCSSDPSTSW
nr:A289 [uncultured bacterium]ART37532.1 E318 [uncultured bacterium]